MIDRTIQLVCLSAFASLLGAGIARADLNVESGSSGDAAASVGSLLQTEFSFTRNSRLPALPKAESQELTRASLTNRLSHTADSTTTDPLKISSGHVLDRDDATPWPSRRQEEELQTMLDTGGDVTAIVSQVPVPGSLLLVAAGLTLAGFSRSRFSQAD